jgi:hypothetical protein
LGIDNESQYQQFEAPLNVGDIIICYTDALVESRASNGEFLGTEGLLRLAGEIRNENPSRLIPHLLSEIAKIDPAYASRDDVTCLAFRPNGLRPAVPKRDLFLAPLRWGLANMGLKFGYSGWKRDPWNAPVESTAQ